MKTFHFEVDLQYPRTSSGFLLVIVDVKSFHRNYWLPSEFDWFYERCFEKRDKDEDI